MKPFKAVYVLSDATVSKMSGTIYCRARELVPVWLNATGEERKQFRRWLKEYIDAYREIEGYRMAKINLKVRRSMLKGMNKTQRRWWTKYRRDKRKTAKNL
jgi:hypothetical protein